MASTERPGSALVFPDTIPLGRRPGDGLDTAANPVAPPLVIDLDGTLLRSDLLIETAAQFLRTSSIDALPVAIGRLLRWLGQGKVALKRGLAEAVEFDPATLPYNDEVVALAREARAAGRQVVLATASHRLAAERIAAHLGLFDQVLATDEGVNLSGVAKRKRLIEAFGLHGFDYVGNATEDLPVWAAARRAIVVEASSRVEQSARAAGNVSQVIRRPASRWPLWRRALRMHQWIKNLLVFVPLLASHELGTLSALALSVVAFVAFGLCASSVYLANDLLDLEDDRHHPGKRHRPFASGDLPVLAGVVGAPLCLLAALVVSTSLLPWPFTATLLTYFGLTAAYTLVLKRVSILDVITLGLLYTLRIIAGAFAIGLDPSFWLLAFSLFMFQSLALVKRYSELHDARARGDEGKTRGRGYFPSDLPILASLGTATGSLAVLVLAFYIQDPETARLYSRPAVIWFACPLLLLWISRVWLTAHRGLMHEDPIVFAIRDRASLMIGTVFGLTFLLAT